VGVPTGSTEELEADRLGAPFLGYPGDRLFRLQKVKIELKEKVIQGSP